MRVIPGNSQHIGMRDQQEDSFGFSNMENAQFVTTSGIMAVLADGMGGLAMGAEASQLAVTSVLDAYETRSQQEPIDESLFRVVHQANNAVKEYAFSIGQEHEMGTTLVAAVIQQDHLYWASVGDSRIYLYRDGNMIQLNKDHVYGQELQEQVARGLISREEAESHPERDALTSYIGIPVLEKIDISHRPVQLKPGDKVMLCSDGLYRTLSKQEMLAYLERDAQEACDSMIDAVLSRRRPYQDNTTILVLEIEAGSQRSVPATTSLMGGLAGGLGGGLSRRQQGDINYARSGSAIAGEEQSIARPSMVPDNLNYKRLAILVGSIVLLLAVLTVGIMFIKDRLGSDTSTDTATTTSSANDGDLVGTARVPGLAEFDFRSTTPGTSLSNSSSTNNNSSTANNGTNTDDNDSNSNDSSDSDNEDSSSSNNNDSSSNDNSDTAGDNNTGNNTTGNNTGDNNTGDNNTGDNNTVDNSTGNQNQVPDQVEDIVDQVPGNINIPSNPEDLF